MMMGRPEKTTITHLVTREQTSFTCWTLELLSASVELSPTPSAYGDSPTATIPTSAVELPGVLLPTKLRCTDDDSPGPWMACQSVVPVVVAPALPCQVIDQPPICRPRSLE